MRIKDKRPFVVGARKNQLSGHVMINYDECINFHRNMEETRKAISAIIRVDYDQVLQIIVSDLLNKYKSLEQRTSNDELLKALKFVLTQYYVTEDEFEKFYANPELIYED